MADNVCLVLLMEEFLDEDDEEDDILFRDALGNMRPTQQRCVPKVYGFTDIIVDNYLDVDFKYVA